MNNLFYETKYLAIHYFTCQTLTSLPHMHKELEMIIVYDGNITAHADNNSYNLKKGDMFLSFPNQIHFYDTYIKGEYGVCIFLPSVIFEQSNLLLNKYPNNNVVTLDKNLNDITVKMQSASGKYRSTIVCGYLNILLGNLITSFDLCDRKCTYNSSILKQFLSFCTEHYREKLTLDGVAEELHVNKYYLSHLISDNLKIHFSDYINSIRINQAINLLEEKDNKIADISEDIGYGTIRSFNRSFKQIMKITPSEYRNRVIHK